MGISVIVLTKNDENILERCLSHLTWCDELLVIDDNSTDKTRNIAKKYTSYIYQHALENDFSKQRNFALEKASSDWVLFVDSDEIVSPQLRAEIQQISKESTTDIQGYYVKRVDHMWGKKLEHGEAGSIWLARLGKRHAGKWQGKVHEVWKIDGKTKKLSSELTHFPHPTISEFLKKINFYSTLRAEELYHRGVSTSCMQIIFYLKVKFIQGYILKRGFLDGIPGLLIALLMSFHSFLVRGKLWQLQNNRT